MPHFFHSFFIVLIGVLCTLFLTNCHQIQLKETNSNETDSVVSSFSQTTDTTSHVTETPSYRIIQDDMKIKWSKKKDKEGAAVGAGAQPWPKNADGKYEVPYDSSGITEDRTIKSIEWAIPYIERGSNIVFRKRNGNDRNYIRMLHGSGCNSWLGCIGGAQDLNLGNGCNTRNVVVHEICHALGLMHEHQRPDRDPHVFVDDSRLDNGWKGQVKKHDNPRLKSDYDLFSMMHYQVNVLGADVLNPRNRTLHDIASVRRSFLSSCDWNILNTFYPGKIKPPKCRPGVIPDLLDPTPEFSSQYGAEKAKWICRYGNELYMESGHCVLKNGKEFPNLEDEFLTSLDNPSSDDSDEKDDDDTDDDDTDDDDTDDDETDDDKKDSKKNKNKDKKKKKDEKDKDDNKDDNKDEDDDDEDDSFTKKVIRGKKIRSREYKKALKAHCKQFKTTDASIMDTPECYKKCQELCKIKKLSLKNVKECVAKNLNQCGKGIGKQLSYLIVGAGTVIFLTS